VKVLLLPVHVADELPARIACAGKFPILVRGLGVEFDLLELRYGGRSEGVGRDAGSCESRPDFVQEKT
jgi:hypothetical protein